MTDFNDIGISRRTDMPRVKKLLCIGLFAAVLHLAGDMILGWGNRGRDTHGNFADAVGVHRHIRQRYLRGGSAGTVRHGA